MEHNSVLRPMKIEDVTNMKVRDVELSRVSLKAFLPEMRTNMKEGPSFTLEVDGKVIWCGGIRVFWEGVGEAWCLISDEGARMPKTVFSSIKKILDFVQKDLALHRVQATARIDIPMFHKFLEHLGFEREGVLRKFLADGTDSYIYSRVRENG